MPPIRLDAAMSLAVALAMLVASGVARAAAQAPAQSQSATVAVSLRVLPHASFERGAETPLSAAVVPGAGVRIAPSAGVRTRMTYDAATRVVVSGGPLRGPGGALVQVRFVCSFGDGMSVSASQPFDCVNGVVAELEGARTTTIPLAIGAVLSAAQTLDVPAGLYTGQVTLTATNAAY
jgi:hypothetical protein